MDEVEVIKQLDRLLAPLSKRMCSRLLTWAESKFLIDREHEEKEADSSVTAPDNGVPIRAGIFAHNPEESSQDVAELGIQALEARQADAMPAIVGDILAMMRGSLLDEAALVQVVELVRSARGDERFVSLWQVDGDGVKRIVMLFDSGVVGEHETASRLSEVREFVKQVWAEMGTAVSLQYGTTS